MGGGDWASRVRARERQIRMAEQFVGRASEFKDGDRQIVRVGDLEIGVFKDKGEFFAYSNYCLHQGGPSCEGLTIAKVEERLIARTRPRGAFISPRPTCISSVPGTATNMT